MRALLDTHAFVWWVADSRRLSGTAFETIRNEGIDVLVSAASAWEITTKQRLGKLPEADALAGDVRAAVADQGFGELAVTIDDAARAGPPARSPSRSVRPHADRPGRGARSGRFPGCTARVRIDLGEDRRGTHAESVKRRRVAGEIRRARERLHATITRMV